MIYFLRPVLAMTTAVVAYLVYCRTSSCLVAREYRLPKRATGYVRLLGAWGVALVAYAFVAETSGQMFTWNWLRECLLLGDWVFIVIASPVLALGDLSWRRRHASALSAK